MHSAGRNQSLLKAIAAGHAPLHAKWGSLVYGNGELDRSDASSRVWMQRTACQCYAAGGESVGKCDRRRASRAGEVNEAGARYCRLASIAL